MPRLLNKLLGIDYRFNIYKENNYGFRRVNLVI